MQIKIDFSKGSCEDDVVKLSVHEFEYFSGSVAEAQAFLQKLEPLMKKRGHFIYQGASYILRSYDAKDAVRILRKILPK